MKRILILILLIVLILPGCASAPVAETDVPTLAASHTTSAYPTPTPAPTPVLTVAPTTSEPTFSPAPTTTPRQFNDVPIITDTLPALSGVVLKPGLRIGSILIANNKYLYHAKNIEIQNSSDEEYSYKTIITQTNLKTKKETTIQTLENLIIVQLFLDGSGNLFYVCMPDDNAVTKASLYMVQKKKDKLISDNVDSVLRVENKVIYYSTSTSKTIYKYSIPNGKAEKVISLEQYTRADEFISFCMVGDFAIGQYWGVVSDD